MDKNDSTMGKKNWCLRVAGEHVDINISRMSPKKLVDIRIREIICWWNVRKEIGIVTCFNPIQKANVDKLQLYYKWLAYLITKWVTCWNNTT